MYGIVFNMSTDDNSASASHMAGGEFVVTEGVTGAKTTSYGTIGRINARATNAGTAVNYYGVAGKMFGAYPSGTTTNNFIGLYTGTCISSDIDCTTGPKNTGTIIDLYIDPSTGGAAHYGIYSPDAGATHYVGGKIGLGTLSPLAKLHVGATSEAVTFGTPSILVEGAGATQTTIRDTTNDVEVLTYVDANGGIFGTTTNHSFALYSNLSPRLTILNTGQIGIGVTPSTNAQLYVKNGTSNGTFAPGGFQYVTTASTNTAANTLEIVLYSTATPAGTLANVGDCLKVTCDVAGAATATTKDLRIRFNGATLSAVNGTILADTGAVTTNGVLATARATVCKNNSNSQVVADWFAQAAGTVGTAIATPTLTATDTGVINIACTCQNGTGNSADCVGKAMTVTKMPAP